MPNRHAANPAPHGICTTYYGRRICYYGLRGSRQSAVVCFGVLPASRVP
jgi:hypothetical protein